MGLDGAVVHAVGADGCRGGWIAALLAGRGAGETLSFHLFADISELAEWRTAEAPNAVVALDVPMGLMPSGGLRPCDVAARKILGPLASSVFPPPARYLLAATSYEEVRALVRERQRESPGAPGLSAQSAAISPKIAEVDDFLRQHAGAQEWLIEVHPELSFRYWAGMPLFSKRSPAGAIERLRLVRGRFPGVEEALSALPHTGSTVGFDDALDACSALWSALRWQKGADVLGGELDSCGLAMRMVV